MTLRGLWRFSFNKREWRPKAEFGRIKELDKVIKDFIKRYRDEKAKQKVGSSNKVVSGAGISKDASVGGRTKLTGTNSLDFEIIPEDGWHKEMDGHDLCTGVAEFLKVWEC